jgi:uncharacterized membrane protein
MESVPTALEERAPMPVRVMRRLENERSLDRAAGLLARVTEPLSARGVRDLLLGRQTGHALHPALTDLPIGLWTSAGLLDLLGGERSRPAAQLLTGAGVLATLPTALTGLAEWREVGARERRVGVAHAALNTAALTLYAASWAQRRSGRHRAGSALSLAGTAFVSASGYLGGHLAVGRKVGYRDPSLAADRTRSATPLA